MSNIYVNPSFIPKNQPKIYINPSFVKKCSHSIKGPHQVEVSHTSFKEKSKNGLINASDAKPLQDPITHDLPGLLNGTKHSHTSLNYDPNSEVNCLRKSNLKINRTLVGPSSSPSGKTCYPTSNRFVSKYNGHYQQKNNYSYSIRSFNEKPHHQEKVLPSSRNSAKVKYSVQSEKSQSLVYKPLSSNNITKPQINPYKIQNRNDSFKITHKNDSFKKINANQGVVESRKLYSLDKRKSNLEKTSQSVTSLSKQNKPALHNSLYIKNNVTSRTQMSSCISSDRACPGTFTSNSNEDRTSIHTIKKSPCKTPLFLVNSKVEAQDKRTYKIPDHKENQLCQEDQSILVNTSTLSKKVQCKNINVTHHKGGNHDNLKPSCDTSSDFFTSGVKLVRKSCVHEKSSKNINYGNSKKDKKLYPVRTKNKVINHTPNKYTSSGINSRYKKPNHVYTPIRRRRSMSLRRRSLTLAKSNSFKKFHTNNVGLQNKMKISKYKLVNRANESLKEVSRYKIDRKTSKYKLNKNDSSPKERFVNSRYTLFKEKRSHLRSDKFISIGGKMYKLTRNTLRKQDSTSKRASKLDKLKQSPSSSRLKPSNFFASRSKFVFKRKRSTTSLEAGTLIEIVRRKKLAQFKRVNDFCFFYNKYGKCQKEKKGCPFIHDPSKIAVCTRFLRGTCSLKECPFSHTLDKSKMPVCSHFLEGSCHKDQCPYRHVRVNPNAPVCKDFLKGHCPQGEECKNKHILICEEFRETGECPRGKSCLLSHRKPIAKNSDSQDSKSESGAKKPSKKRKNLAKIGVLGLVKVAGENEDSGNCKSSSAPFRYFECQEEVNDTAESEDHLNITSESISSESLTKESQPLSHGEGFADKRRRLLKKVEKLKRNYTLGMDCQGQEKDIAGDESSAINTVKETTVSTVETAIPRFPPLPDVLPSYIPLIWPEDEPK